MTRTRPSAPFVVAWLAMSVALHGAVAVLVAQSPGGTVAPPRPATSSSLPGETFEVPVEDRPVENETSAGLAAQTAVAPTLADEGTLTEPGDAPPTPRAETHPHARPRTAVAGTTSPAGSGPGEADHPGTFGAAGDLSSVDLASAFTRGFPQAASADPLWLAAPFGSAGSVDVTFTIDESGALLDTHSSGTPGDALAAGVRRTLALIRARSFVAEGRETRLRVTATVTQDEVHDGLHGEVFAIGGSFRGADGSGFFALTVGRRIDVRVRVLR